MLTGRDAELQDIDELLRQATVGGSGVLVLRGDPGIGKTALVDYAARHAGPMRVLRATGIEAESELGFAGVGLPCRDLAGLSPDATERLVETIAGTKPASGVARRLHAETGGNPLALVELSATLTAAQLGGAELPEAPLEPGTAIRLRFAARLDRLSAPARTALLVAAAAGRCPLPDVTAVAGQLALADHDVFAEAETAGLIYLARGGVEFSHPLVRSVAYHLATPAQRRAAHLALAGQLSGRDAERAAWHLAAAAAGPDDTAAAALDAAAALAARKGAPLEAAAAWERAAELSSDAELTSARLSQAAQAALNGADLDRVRRLTRTLPAPEERLSRGRMLAVRAASTCSPDRWRSPSVNWPNRLTWSGRPIRCSPSSYSTRRSARPWRPGCTTRPARPPTAWPIWPNDPMKPPASWPTSPTAV